MNEGFVNFQFYYFTLNQTKNGYLIIIKLQVSPHYYRVQSIIYLLLLNISAALATFCCIHFNRCFRVPIQCVFNAKNTQLPIVTFYVKLCSYFKCVYCVLRNFVHLLVTVGIQRMCLSVHVAVCILALNILVLESQCSSSRHYYHKYHIDKYVLSNK